MERRSLLSAGIPASIVGAILALSLLLLLSGIVRADEEVVPTSAQVNGGGLPPNIECKWELPDMVSRFADNTFPDANIQYDGTTTPALHLHDDDMETVPDADNATDGAQVPCSGPPDTVATMPGGVHNMIQVRPNPNDLPEERRIQLWAAVDHPNGISNIADVYWKIFHPLGDEKIQVHGTKVDMSECDPTTGGLGNSASTGKMMEAAVHTGQLTADAVDDINNGMLAKCLQGGKAIYYASFDLSKHQPCGEYRVEVTAVAVGGQTAKLSNYIDVECVYFLEIDFGSVDWGTITPGLTDIVLGNLFWDSPLGNAPTVRNVGNDGMGLGLTYTPMVGATEGKVITEFDACYGKSPSTLDCYNMAAGEYTEFGEGADQVLCSNEMGKLDLSIHPPSILPVDSYSGAIDVIGYPVPKICDTFYLNL
ncbi:MAG: hypothetical protein V3S37_05870 [Dehalococcoidia bacterium]